MINFTLFVQNSDGSNKYEIPFDRFSFTEELNKDRSANFSINYSQLNNITKTFGATPESVLTGRFKELYLYDQNNNLIHSGYVSEFQINVDTDGRVSVSISSKGWFSLLHKRVTNSLRSYSSEDLSDIAWDLIDYTQSLTYGDLGITRGANPTTRNAARTYRYANIGEAIEKMSNNEIKNGFDFDIDSEKKFNVYYGTKGSSKPLIPLVYGENIEYFQIYKTATDNLANQVIVFGEGMDSDQLVEVRDAENVYKDQYYLLQETLSEVDIKTSATLQEKGDLYLDYYKYPKLKFSCNTRFENPDWNSYALGDTMTIDILFLSFNKQYRLIKRTLNSNGEVGLIFDLA